jgi:hypothetical protein
MADQNATDAVSRRNVLKATGGLLAGATMLAGQGTAVAAETEEGLRFEVQEMTAEYVAGRVRMSEELYERVNERGALAERVFLGLADQFVVHEGADAVSLPEDHEAVLATPVEMDFENPREVTMYFRTRDIDWPENNDDEGVTLGLGVFPERTIPDTDWDTGTVAVDVTCPEC